MAANATLNLALDRTSGRFSVDEGSTRLYVYDAAIDLSVGGWTRDEVAIGQDGKTMYEPYFQIVCGGMVLAEAKLNGVENPEEGEDEYFMTGTLSTNTVQMAAMFCGCAASETMRQFEARIFSTTSANPIATGRVSVWSFPSGGSNPANLPSASEALAALRTDLDNHTENEDIHVTAQEKAAWTGKQNALTFDSAPTEDSQNPVTSGGVKAALDAEAQARVQNDTALGNAISAEATARHAADDELGEDITEERNRAEGEENRIQGDLNTHKENFTIHVTATDKAAWNAKVDPATLLGYVNGGDYDSETRRILFKHDNTVIAWIDATPFIVDGMVDNVYISGSYLVIKFNTDAGKQAINIPLTDIFNPANYYDKTAADARFVQKETGKGLSANDYTDADKAKVDGALLKSGGTMTGELSVNYHPGQSGQSVVTLTDDKVTIGSASINAQYQADRITRKYLGNSVDLLLPFASGTIALTADATLTPVFDPDPAKAVWVCDPPQVEGYPAYSVAWSDISPYAFAWVLSGGDGSQDNPESAGDPDAATVSFVISSHGITPGMPETVTATRVPVGYYLGSDQTKILTPKEVADALAASVAAKYTKPSGGIPKSDLASGVQTSLGKADVAAEQVAPAWVSGATYAADALVSYNGIVYQNISGVAFVSDIPPPGDTNWGARPVESSLASLRAGKADKADLPYSQSATTLDTARILLSARSANRYDLSAVTGEVAVTLPTITSGKCADVVCTIVTGATVPTLSFPANAVFIAADSAWQTLAASSYNVFSFTSTGAPNEWIVGRITSALPTA